MLLLTMMVSLLMAYTVLTMLVMLLLKWPMYLGQQTYSTLSSQT